LTPDSVPDGEGEKLEATSLEMETSSLETFKAKLNGALNNLV